MDSFADIVDAAGGYKALAEQLQASGVPVTRNRCWQWRTRDVIPAEYWTALIRLSPSWSPPRALTAEQMAGFAARKLERTA